MTILALQMHTGLNVHLCVRNMQVHNTALHLKNTRGSEKSYLLD